MKTHFVILFFSAVCSFNIMANSSPTTTLKYDLGVNGGWVPYHTGVNKNQIGVFEEITNLIQKNTPILFKELHFPPKRAEFALQNETVDFDFVCAEWFPDNKFDKDQYVLSDSILVLSEYFITLKGNAHLIKQREDAHKTTVGTIAGYFYHDDEHFNRMDFLNEGTLILGLKHERFKTAILEQETAKYWADKHRVQIDFAALHSQGKLRFRLLKKHQALLPLINNAIAKLKQDGSLKKIIDNHNLDAKILD